LYICMGFINIFTYRSYYEMHEADRIDYGGVLPGRNPGTGTAEKKNLSEVANELIAEGLQRRKAKIKQEFKLVSYSMGKPRVNLGDRNALEALMDS
jgi:hypothetical protein